MRTVQIYIENQRIDLFEDERIEVVSSIQNISDLSKVFTDFSQSFSIPATKKNNAIFDHYYNNDVDGTFDAQVRVDARIEINYKPFREGKIQLEGAEIVKGKAESYKVGFFGDVVTIKDLFGNDKLSDLDYTGIQFTYTGAAVQNTVTSTSDLDVRFPLISSENVWTYGDAGANDISLVGNPIDYTELFPAIKDSKLFSLIQSKYGLTFQGGFFSNKRFDNSYLWWKNRATQNFITEPLDLVFDVAGSGNVVDSAVNLDYIDVSTLTPPADLDFWTGDEWHYINVYISCSSFVTYYLDVFKNGVYTNTFTGTGITQTHPIFVSGQPNTNGLNDTYTFQIRSTAALTFTADIRWSFKANYISTTVGVGVNNYLDSEVETTASLSTLAYYDFAGTAPDMKIADYFAGTLSQFNCTCYPTEDALTFKVLPLNDWYQQGDRINITEYVDIDKIQIDRPKLYNEIAFSFLDSKSFMNEAYKDFYGKNYGDLKEVLGYDGGKYEVKLPFENLLFQKFDNENLQVGYSLTRSPDYKPYIPKPTKLYLGEEQTTDVDFYFDDGTSSLLNAYMPFGQDVEQNTANYSMNWGNEQSSLLEIGVENSLYKTYYQKYLVNLFNTKTRVVTVKCILPISVLTQLTLEDKLIIRDKEYRINTMKSELTSGVVELELLSDFTGGKSLGEAIPIVPCAAVDLKYELNIIKPLKEGTGGYTTMLAVLESSVFITAPVLPTTYYADNVITVTAPANATGADRTNTIPVEYYNGQGQLVYTDYIVIYQEACDAFILTEGSDILMTEGLDNLRTE